MATTTTSRRDRPSSGPAAYLCWSHDNNRMEMTDLPGYLDSLQRSYDSVQQAYSSMAGTPAAAPTWGFPTTSERPRERDRRRQYGGSRKANYDHDDCGCGGHERDCGCAGRQRDCACGAPASCRCTCCIEDADIIVYAHCGEVRVVPIEIENDTRKAREDVSLDISDVRTAGGRVLPWATASTVQGPLVLDACSTTRFEILVNVDCAPRDRATEEVAETSDPAAGKAKGGKLLTGADVSSRVGSSDVTIPTFHRGTKDRTDVDECVVGYFTVRLGGCLTRPIVVAIAALPYSCDSYRTGCACASCC